MKLLFLCTGNSCRSQMAEGLARALAPPDWELYSAGIEAHGLNPHMLTVMHEAEIDVSGQTSKTVAQVPWDSMDLIITLCDHAAQHCPVLPVDCEVLHWSLADPALAVGPRETVLQVYRDTRDAIRERLTAFLAARVPA